MVDIAPIERIISGKGVIVIPPEEWSSALQIFLYVQVVRPPRNQSLNLTFNPDKSFYAHITFCIDDFVLYSLDVNFENQVYEIISNQPAQNLLSLICAYEGILDSFVQYAIAQGIPYTKNNLIQGHPYLRFSPNRIRFECYADTALKLTLKGTELVKCKEEDGTAQPPPPPPPPEPKVPSNTPVPVSPPIEGEDDDGDTIPFPIDEPPPPLEFPIGERCSRYLCIAEILSDSAPVRRRESIFFGEIEDFKFNAEADGQPSSITIRAYGIPLPEGDDVCNSSPTDYIFLQSSLGERTIGNIISVELAS